MPDAPANSSSLILYQTEDGRTRVQCRFENETVWLTQALMATLFQKDVRTINEHLQNIYHEGGLTREATIRNFLITGCATLGASLPAFDGTRDGGASRSHYCDEASQLR